MDDRWSPPKPKYVVIATWNERVVVAGPFYELEGAQTYADHHNARESDPWTYKADEIHPT